jgi:hypothetical protein
MSLAVIFLQAAVVFQGHVAVLYPANKDGVVAALAPVDHATRVVILADQGQVASWDANGSGLRLKASTLPSTALPYTELDCGGKPCASIDAIAIGGRSAVEIEIPEGQQWDLTVSEPGSPVDLSVEEHLDATRPALRMKDLSKKHLGRKRETMPLEFSSAVRLRMLIRGFGATLLPGQETDSYRKLSFDCSPLDTKDQCRWQSGVAKAKLTDRIVWKSTRKTLEVSFARRDATGLSPRLELEPSLVAEIWLINDAREYASHASKETILHHLRAYRRWLVDPPTGDLAYDLKQQAGAGPVFCPAVAIAY